MIRKQPLPWFRPLDSDPCFCLSGQAFADCCGSRAKDRKPPAGALLFPEFVKPVTCRKWVSRLEKKAGLRSPVHMVKKPGAASVASEENSLRVCSDVKPGVLRKLIDNRVAEAFKLAAAKTGRTVAWYETPSILRYQSGGYYMRHADSCLVDPATNTWLKIHDRDLSLLIYLNEDYTGGGLSFVNFNYHLRPRAGDMLAFPSDNRYEHQAEIVQSGVRYVVVSWAAFNGSERVSDTPPQGAIQLTS
jgi:predicted 2-oxoglutarate/Fe(II)-dependent dioxygenase YbiX